jgi:hypothetical protein
MERRGPNGKPVPFSFKYKKLSTGEEIFAENAICTSSYYVNGTANIQFENKQTRKLQVCLFTEFNGQEVFL